MKKLFEEYGTVILVVVVIILLLGTVVFTVRPGGALDGAFEKFFPDTPTDAAGGITLPVDDLDDITRNSTVPVTGTVTSTNGDIVSVVVTVNGTAKDAVIDGDGNWSVEVDLSEGSNIIVVQATDTTGESSSVTKVITKDSTGPDLTVDPLPDTTTNPYTVVSGKVTDDSGVASLVVSINGTNYNVDVAENGSWSVGVDLEEGNNSIVVKATDKVGNTTTKTDSIVCGTSGPELTVEEMVDITNNAKLTVKGSANDDDGVASVVVKVGTKEYPATVGADGKWSVEVDLTEGMNPIKVVATDNSGNYSTADDSVILDTTPPELTLNAHPDTTELSKIGLGGKVSDANGVASVIVKINGAAQTATLDNSGNWSVNVDLNAGNNSIEVVAMDKAGNSTSKSDTIRRLVAGVLELSATEGTLTYPTTGTYKVTKNTSGGELSVKSSNEDVVTVTIDGDTVTMKPGTKAGKTTITVTSAAKGSYTETTATYTVTVKNGTLSVTAEGWSGEYDGKAHGISVTCDGATITYAASENGTYSSTNPTYKDAGTYTVYYKVVKAGYTTVTGSKKVVINKSAIDAVPSQDGTLTYNGEEQTPSWKNYDSAKMTIGGTTKGTDAGTYSATITPKANYQWSDGTTDAKTVTWKIGKADGFVGLSANEGALIYPDEGKFSVEVNVSGGTLSVESSDESVATVSISGKMVTVQSGAKSGKVTITVTSAETDNYKAASATCVVTVQAGTLGVTAEGYTGTYDGKAHGITVTCDGATITYATSENGTYGATNPTYKDAGTYTVYYKVEKAGYATVTGSKKVVINKASIDVNALPAQDGTLTYNGKGQTPEWKNYDSAKMTIGGTVKGTNAGTYSATFTPNANYQWSDGTTGANTVTWKIGKAEGSVVLSDESGTLTYPESGSFKVETNTSGGELSVKSSNENVATVTIKDGVVTVKSGTEAGEAIITVTSAATDNYKAASATYTVTVKNGALNVKAEGWSGEYDGQAHGISVKCDGATITYATSKDGEYGATNPTYKDAGTYTVYYKVVKAGYADVTGSKTVVIDKAIVDDVPSQNGSLTYTGKEQTPSWKNYDSTKMTIGGTTKGTNAGTYSATFTPKANYQWSDGTTGAKTVTWKIGKADGRLKLSATEGTLTYPTEGTFTVETNTSGGTLSVKSSDEDVATVTIDGNTVTVKPGTKAGKATITVTSGATGNHTAASATYAVTVEYEEVVGLAPGLYKTGSDYTVLLKSWETLIDEGIIAENGAVVSGQEDNLAGDLVIADSITQIVDESYMCTALTGVIIPEGVISIGECAFNGCYNLTSVGISEGVTYIGSDAFGSCGLITLEIPDGVTSMGSGAFIGNSALESVVIGSGMTSIPAETFNGCYALTSVEIGNSVTSIEENSFLDCGSLTSITIPDNVICIETNAFAFCYCLTDIIFTGTVTQWNEAALADSFAGGSGWYHTSCPEITVTCTGDSAGYGAGIVIMPACD